MTKTIAIQADQSTWTIKILLPDGGTACDSLASDLQLALHRKSDGLDLQSFVSITEAITRKVSNGDHSHYEVDYTFAKITNNRHDQGST